MTRVPSRLPSLGPRGEGWFFLQVLFIAAVAFAPQGEWPAAIAPAAPALGALLGAGGLLAAARGILDLGVNLTPFPMPKPGAILVERGAYRLIRNPIYAGLLLMSFGWALWRASSIGLAVSVAFAIFLDLKVRREETLLAQAFPTYDAYRRRTQRFVPGLY